jgi:hypothetical protein
MGNIRKEDFCNNCSYAIHIKPTFLDPGSSECPGNFDPDSIECPRYKEWLEEESYNEIDEINA